MVIFIAFNRIPHRIEDFTLAVQIPRHRIAVVLDNRIRRGIIGRIRDRIGCDIFCYEINKFFFGNILDVIF